MPLFLSFMVSLSLFGQTTGLRDTIFLVEGGDNSYCDIGIYSGGFTSQLCGNGYGILAAENSFGISSQSNYYGLEAISNSNDGLRSLNNDGYAAYLTSPSSRLGAAVYISHNEDLRPDLYLGGQGRITSDEHIYLRVDQDNSSNAGKVFFLKNDGTQIAAFSETGNSAINTNLDVFGFIRACGNITANTLSCSSDQRYKKNVIPLTNSLSNISFINGVRYDWDQERWPERNFSNGPQIGFIAQELEAVYPELVHTNNEGYKSVAYDKMTAILVEAVKELKEENEELKKKLEKMDYLEDRISKLERLE